MRPRPVLNLWRALAKRDWEAVKAVVSDDCIFIDMSLGPTVAARGPDNIVKRLKSALENENLANYANHDVLVLSNGVDVMYEHLETFTSSDGETASNPIVSVHKVSDGKVSLWKDYWDLNAIAEHRMVPKLRRTGAGFQLDVRRNGSDLIHPAITGRTRIQPANPFQGLPGPSRGQRLGPRRPNQCRRPHPGLSQKTTPASHPAAGKPENLQTARACGAFALVKSG